MMRCDEARGLLWPPEQPKLAETELLEARQHVEACESCQDYLALDAALLDGYRTVPRILAPPGLRERVFDVLAQERLAATQREPRPSVPLRQPLSRWGALALGVAAFLVVVSLAGRSPVDPSSSVQTQVAAPAAEEGAAFVDDFLRRAVQAEHLGTSDPGEVAEFLQRELGIAVAMPLDAPDFDLAGVEICIVEGVRGAVIMYKQNGVVLYHYVIPKPGEGEAEPSLSTASPPQWAGSTASPSVVTWATQGGMQQALVSDLPPEDLLAIARGLAREI